MTLEQIEKQLQEEREFLVPMFRPLIQGTIFPQFNDKGKVISNQMMDIRIYFDGNNVSWNKMILVHEWGTDGLTITFCERLNPLTMQVPFRISKEKGLEILKNILHGE